MSAILFMCVSSTLKVGCYESPALFVNRLPRKLFQARVSSSFDVDCPHVTAISAIELLNHVVRSGKLQSIKCVASTINHTSVGRYKRT